MRDQKSAAQIRFTLCDSSALHAVIAWWGYRSMSFKMNAARVAARIFFMIAVISMMDANAAGKMDFVAVKGTQFLRHGQPYYIVGTNMWYGGYLGSKGNVG
ncbi:MAG: hypothetical protein ABUL58_05140, partial [Steroidobacter sp.]